MTPFSIPDVQATASSPVAGAVGATTYWRLVQAKAAELPAEVNVTPIDNPLRNIRANPDMVIPVTREIGAECLVRMTHRLATPAEVEAAKQRELERLAADKTRDNARRMADNKMPIIVTTQDQLRQYIPGSEPARIVPEKIVPEPKATESKQRQG